MGATELQSAIRGMGIGVSLIALFLGLRQWYEHRARSGLSEADGRFYRRQAVRRWLGVVVLATLAAVVVAGARVEPRIGNRGNLTFVAVWLAVLGLIVVTLGVAFWDSVATWRYARNRRHELVREHLDEVRRHMRTVAEAVRREQAAEADDTPAAGA